MGRLPVTTQVNTITVDPASPERVYVAGPAGVFRSDDAGQTWQAANGGLGDVEIVALSLDPARQGRVFAGAADSRIFESLDGGTTWGPWAR